MQPPLWMYRNYVRSQFFLTLPEPTKSFAGQTIIVTGASAGLGLEAARYFVRLSAERVILAVRSIERGRKAQESIRQSEPNSKTIMDVWELDLARYASILAFAERVNKELDTVDVVVENAGGSTNKYRRAEDNEYTITVNFVSTMLLGLLLIPKLRESSVKLGKDVVLTFVGSHMHWLAKFKERNADNIIAALGDEKNTSMNDRYNVSKLMLLMSVRELADRLSHSSKGGHITTSIISPGSVGTLVARGASSVKEHVTHWAFDHILGRPVEEGARTLVWAAYGGRDTDGKFLDDCEVAEQKTSTFSNSQEGHETQRKLWKDLIMKLESISPGIAENI